MAVTPTDLATLTDLAKDYFTNVYTQLFNPETPTKAQFSRLEGADFAGKKWIFGVKTAPGGGSANAGANKTLPAAQAGQYDQGEVTLKRTYTRMALDGFVIEVTKQQKGSFRPALAETMADRLLAHDLEVNRQMFCDGSGKLVSIPSSATGANATQQLDQDYAVAHGGTPTRHIYIGDLLAFYQSDATTLIGKKTVTSKDDSLGQITVDSSITTTNSGFVARATSDTDNIVEGEVNGMLVAVKSSGTFETIPATSQGWKAIEFTNSGTLRPISDPLVMQMIRTIRSRSRLTPDLVITRPGIVLKYSELFLPLYRLNGQDVQLKGGYKPVAAIQHGGGTIPVIEDEDCPESRMFFLNTSTIKLADAIGTGWADMDGASFDRVVDKDAIEGYIRKYWNLAWIQRNANGVIADLNDISAIDKVG